jgi:hypothetical protein
VLACLLLWKAPEEPTTHVRQLRDRPPPAISDAVHVLLPRIARSAMSVLFERMPGGAGQSSKS